MNINFLRSLLQKTTQSPLIKNISTVAVGTGIAQIFPIIFYPLLARIFPPSEFGLLAIVVSIVPILSVIASGAFEGAILLSKSKVSSINLAAYILIRSSFILMLFLLLIIFFGNQIAILLNEPRLNQWLYVVPVLCIGVIFVNLTNEWFVKYKYFSRLSLNKALYTITNVLSKVALGLLGSLKTGGLVLGDLAGKMIMMVYVSLTFLHLDKDQLRHITKSRIFNSTSEVKDFPKFVMPDQIISNLGGSIHVFFISAFFGATELGYVAIVSSILYAPITVFSSAIKDVFRQRAKEDFDATGSCRELYIKLLPPVAGIAFLGFGTLYLIIPPFFNIFLGEQWIKAADYAQIMIPLFFFSFISMALKDVFIVVKKMHIALYWQFFFIFLLLLSLIISTYLYDSLEVTLYFMTVANSFSYFLYIFLSYYFAKA